MSRSFGADSTTEDVLAGVDLTGRRILITGVSAGLGAETARALVSHGADVVGTARNLDKAQAATRGVQGAGSLDLIALDLASLASVRAAADALLADGRPFDVIIANAGVMATPQGRTADGFETQFGTNHLGHFVLVNRIASLLRPGGRVVMLSSAGHHSADVDLDDPDFDHTPYDPFVAYGRSKTANVLFAVEFDRRHRDRGIRATAVHPGVILTELVRHMSEDATQELMISLAAREAEGETAYALKTIPQGAATSVWAAAVADAEAIGGRYCLDCQVAAVDDETADGVRSYALDPARARDLWAKSEDMTGERF